MLAKIVAIVSVGLAAGVGAAALPDSSTAPLDGWHAFTALCAQHGGPTDAVRMQVWDGKEFADGDTWRVECGDVEVVIPSSWYDAGMAEYDQQEHDKT